MQSICEHTFSGLQNKNRTDVMLDDIGQILTFSFLCQ